MIEVVLDAGATIGESATWSPTESALYWIDVKKPALYRYHPASEAQCCWPVQADIGGFALRADLSGAIVALRTGLFDLDFGSGLQILLAPAPFDPALFRFNEGGCDPNGRFWIGVMYDPLMPNDDPPRKGALHSYMPAGGLRPESDWAELHNGMAWSADGHRLFLSHSNDQTIHVYDVSSGVMTDQQLFATVSSSLGVPDGAAIDTDGGYWCAIHGGSRLRRFAKDGSVDRDIALPVSQPTMCAFGGDRLDELYITSATEKLSPTQRAREPLAGALLRLRPGEIGVSRRCSICPS